MSAFIKLIQSLPFKAVVLLLLVFATFYWIFNGLSWCQNRSKNDAEVIVADFAQKLARKDPNAAAELAQLQKTRNETALAATLRERYELNGVDGLYLFAKDARERNPYDLRLASMAVDTNLISDANQRTPFLYAHANHLQQVDRMRQDFRNEILDKNILSHENRYLDVLENAAKNPDHWRRVRENPMMVHLMMNVKNPQLLDFYDREQLWLDDVLYLLRTAVEDEPQDGVIKNSATDNTTDETLERILTTVHVNHPYFYDAIKEYLNDPKTDPEVAIAAVFSLFDQYGETIRFCVREKAIPQQELLDVLFANPDYCEKYAEIPPETFAAKLITIREQMPNVWKNHSRPLVFQLLEDVPHLADSLCKKFGSDDIAAFLYLNYADTIPSAAAAIDTYGDLGIYVLSKYSQSETFRKHLDDTRIVPYVAQFEDAGLERLDLNKAWIDKYFDAEGNFKKEQWWRALPGGAAVGVAKNWADGVPNEWSELGWAALDTAEAAALVLTLGASTSASAAKSTATTAAKAGTQTAARKAMSSALKSRSRTTARGARTAAKEQQSSLIRRTAARTSNTSLRLTPKSLGGRIRWGLRAAETVVVSPLKTVTSKTYQAARSLHGGWNQLSPGVRRAAYKSLLVTGLTVTIFYRTIPMITERLPEFGKHVGEMLADMVKAVPQSVAAALDGFLEQLLGPGIVADSFRAKIVYFLVLLALAATTLWYAYRNFVRYYFPTRFSVP